MFTPLYFSKWTFLFIYINRLWLLLLISAYLRKHCYNNIFLISQMRFCSTLLFFRVLFPLTPNSVDLSTLWLLIIFVMYTFYSLKLYLLYIFVLLFLHLKVLAPEDIFLCIPHSTFYSTKLKVGTLSDS